MRIIVPYGSGSVPDTPARLFGQRLSERLGQPFVVHNRPGAGSNIGTEAVVRAPADGYTLLAIAGANYIDPLLYDQLHFNFVRESCRSRAMAGASYRLATPVDSGHSIPELMLTPAPTREC